MSVPRPAHHRAQSLGQPHRVVEESHGTTAALPPPGVSGERNREKFFFVHYPGGWGFRWSGVEEDDGEFLPVLSTALLKPGVNGVEDPPERGLPVRITRLLAGIEAKGGIVIQSNDVRMPSDLRKYLASYPVEGGGKSFIPAWMSAVVLPNKQVSWTEDTDHRLRFERAVRDHIAPAMMPAEFAAIRAPLVERIGRRERSPNFNAAMQALNDEDRRRLAAMDAAWDAYQAVQAAAFSAPAPQTEEAEVVPLGLARVEEEQHPEIAAAAATTGRPGRSGAARLPPPATSPGGPGGA